MHLLFTKVATQLLALGLLPQLVFDPSMHLALYTWHHLVPRSMSEAVWAETEAAKATAAMMNEIFMMDV